jgi:streptogrisin D
VKRRSTLLRYAIAVAVTAALSAAMPSAATAASPPANSAGPDGRQKLANLAATLEKGLGSERSAGSYLDQATGRLVVNVTDDSAAQSVRAAGATPRTVTRSRADLTRATETLDGSARIPGTAWGIDPQTNQVVISADETVKGDKLAKLESVTSTLGAAARIELISGKLSTLTGPPKRAGNTTLLAGNPTMLLGSPVYTPTGGGPVRCSLGYNTFIANTNRHFFITAGHCTHAGIQWLADEAFTQRLGSNRGLSDVYGELGDFGVIEYDTPGIHVYGTVAGSGKFITSVGDAVVGLSIRRSGSSTGVRGGQVILLDTTVNYEDGTTVHGLITTTACADRGDSGGPLYDGGSIGLGLLSGGSVGCGSFFALTFYQPLRPIVEIYYPFTLWDVPAP